jgi:hypothetical protein
VNRQTLLWSIVVFFGASIVFAAINNATEGESTATRLGFQVLALAVIVMAVVLFVRKRG